MNGGRRIIPIGSAEHGAVETNAQGEPLMLEQADGDVAGGENGAKEAGKLRQEGKEYVVHDGDVMHFKFNV